MALCLLLTDSCAAMVQLLYRQRTFDFVFPALFEFIRAHLGSAASVEALIAFSHVVANSPKAIYTPHLAQIFPLMVQAINMDDAELGSSAVRTFRVLLFESVDGAKPFLKDVFPGLLKQAQFAYAVASRCRVFCKFAVSSDPISPYSTHRTGAMDRHDALECLSKLATIPYELIHPYKDSVLRKLLLVLDDRKRFVRHTAVRVRNQWSVL